MLYNGDFDFYYLGKGDPYVFTEQKRDYGRIADRAEGRNVLDFGAHCGFFNIFLSRNYPPRRIVSIEPDPRALPVLQKNCRADTKIISAAVVDKTYDQDGVNLYLGKTFMATNSVEPYQGRQLIRVPTVSFQSILRRYQIQFLKCDCEGGEYGLDWSDLLPSVETIAIEFHFNRPAWADRMEEINSQLEAQGFTFVKRPKVNNFSKISTGLYTR